MMLVFYLLVPVLGYSLVTGLIAALASFDGLTATAAGAALVSPFFLFMYQKEQKQQGEKTDQFKMNAKSCLFVAGLGIVVCIMVNNIISISPVSILFPGFDQVAEELYAPSVWIQVIAMGILIPSAEEFIFRGFAFRALRYHMAFWPAAVVSGIFFAIYHGNVVQGVYAFILALFLTWVYERFHTLLAPYLFHSAANVISVIMTNTILSGLGSSSILFWTETIMSVLLTLVFLWLIDKNTYPKEEKT